MNNTACVICHSVAAARTRADGRIFYYCKDQATCHTMAALECLIRMVKSA